MHASSLKIRYRNSQKRSKLDDGACLALNGAQLALNLLSQASSSMGIPALSASVSSLSVVIQMYQKTVSNTQDMQNLLQYLEDLTKVIANVTRPGMSKSMQDRLNRLMQTWSDIADKTLRAKDRNRFIRFINSTDDQQTLQRFLQSISRSIDQFLVASVFESENAIHNRADGIEERLNDLQQKTRLDITVPPYAVDARFDCNNQRESCLEGTRIDVLHRVYGWIHEHTSRGSAGGIPNISSLASDSDNPVVFWINGLAGTGKTTLAYTIAAFCQKNLILGASFFCSRDSAECSNPMFLFNTVAYQLGLFFPPFAELVSAALKNDPLITHSSVLRQLEELIISPLSALRDRFPPCVIILDALDECKDERDTSTVLLSLAKHVHELQPLKFLVTSRPEQRITASFRGAELRSATDRLLLHEVAMDVMETDIERYVTNHLQITKDLYCIQDPWPSSEDLLKLTRLSEGLFVFAATAVKVVADRNFSDPIGQLQSVLSTNTAVSLHRRLDQLYLQILNNAFPEVSPNLANRLDVVLGGVVLLQNPLSESDLNALLELPQSAIRTTLSHLNAVVVLPESKYTAIRIIHPTFAEFLTDPSRCTSPLFSINVERHHMLLFQHCMHAMVVLRRDMCNIRDPSKLNSEIEDLPQRIDTYITPSVRYSCRYWAAHFSHGTISDDAIQLLFDFCSVRILYWVEVCSLLGILRDALHVLHAAKQMILHSAGAIPQDPKLGHIAELLSDCERFILAYFPGICTAALHVYYSALPFTPTESRLRQTYRNELANSVSVRSVLTVRWGAHLQALAGHGDAVSRVKFSPDGSQILSVSLDGTIRLWDSVAGTQLDTFRCMKEEIICQTDFSREGVLLVLAATLNGLRLWDPVSGESVVEISLLGPYGVMSFSPDSSVIACALLDNTIHIYDITSGKHLRVLEGHSATIKALLFASNGIRLISLSYDLTIRVWDVSTGTQLTCMSGYVEEAHFIHVSAQGDRILAVSAQRAFRLLDISNNTCILTIKGDWGKINTVAFTPDGKQVLSGHQDGTISIWDCTDGTQVRTFGGRKGDVMSVDVSPDGTRLVSGTSGKLVRLWDLKINDSTQGGHSPSVGSAAFSPNNKQIVYGLDDNSLRVNDAAIGTTLMSMHGHSNSVVSVGFSPNGSCIVSAADDITIRLWDARTGTTLCKFTGHSRHLTGHSAKIDKGGIVTFRTEANGWIDSVKLWQDVTCAQTYTFGGHSAPIMFSRDGKQLVAGSESNDSVSPEMARMYSQGDNFYFPFSFLQFPEQNTPDIIEARCVRLWDTTTGTLLRTLDGHSSHVLSVAFSFDASKIVSGSADCTIRVWETLSGACLRLLEGHSAPVVAVAISPDSAHIVSGSRDHTVRLWNACSGAKLRVLPGHTSEVWSVAFSPDNNFVISADAGSLRIWDPISGTQIMCCTGNHEWVTDVNFLDDGSGFVAGPDKTVVRLWSSGDETELKTIQHSMAQKSDGSFLLPRQQGLIFVLLDGWIFVASTAGRKRLCWLSPEISSWKACQSNQIVVGAAGGSALLDFTAQLETLYMR